MNARAFRAEHFIDHFMTLLEKYHFDCIAPDQDYLNEIGEGRILHLNPRWDAMPNENTEPLLAKEDKTEQDPNNWAKVKKREAVTL